MFTTLHSFEALHELTQAYYAIKFHFHDKQLKSWRFISYFFREVTTIIIEQHDEILMSLIRIDRKNRVPHIHIHLLFLASPYPSNSA